ncbi:MAG: hypothetical protein ACJ73J_07850 [Actinomycetes bacterium]
MIRTPAPTSARSRTLLAALFFSSLAALVLSGCGAGSSAQTSQPYNPGDGRNVNIPADATFKEPYLAVRNALVVSNGSAASVTVSVVNHSDETDVLSEIKVNDKVAAFVGGPFEIPPKGQISVGGGSDATALVSDAGVEPGQWTELTLTFTNAGSTVVDVVVVASDDEYTVLGEGA